MKIYKVTWKIGFEGEDEKAHYFEKAKTAEAFQTSLISAADTLGFELESDFETIELK